MWAAPLQEGGPPMNPLRVRIPFATLAVLALAGVPAHALDINSCGAVIPDGEVGTLTADLVCTDPASAITIGAGSRLILGGHRVEGLSADGPTSISVIRCASKRCTIVGPGEVVGREGVGSKGGWIWGLPDGQLGWAVQG